MRILLVHNRYRSGTPGGEDVVFEQERELLSKAGHEVQCYTRSNDEMDERSLTDHWHVVWSMQRSQRTFRELGQLIRRFRPEVAHFHNIFPLISGSGYEACLAEGVPIVQTIHNYRFSCSAATHFRAGAVCELCTPADPWAAVRFACYRQSRLASLAVAAMMFRNHIVGVPLRHVSRFIALTNFAAQRLEMAGIPRERIVIKPNSIDTSVSFDEIERQLEAKDDALLFVGRLSVEKGVRFLLHSWLNLREVPLRIVGDGPLRRELEEFARSNQLPVEFLGFRDRSSLSSLMRSGRALIFPSLWFEGMPMTLLESMAAGTPVIASRIGGIPEIVEHGVEGLLFDPGNANQLQSSIRRLLRDRTLQRSLCEAAHRKALDMYNSESNVRALIGIYDGARGVQSKPNSA